MVLMDRLKMAYSHSAYSLLASTQSHSHFYCKRGWEIGEIVLLKLSSF